MTASEALGGGLTHGRGSDGIGTDRRGPGRAQLVEKIEQRGDVGDYVASRAETVARRTPISLYPGTQLRTVTIRDYREIRCRNVRVPTRTLVHPMTSHESGDPLITLSRGDELHSPLRRRPRRTSD